MDYKWLCLPQQEVALEEYRIAPVNPNHIERIRHWRNGQMDVLRQLKPISEAEQRKYYQTRIWPEMALDRPKNILMIFCLQDEPIGYGGLVHIAWEHLRAEVSFLLAPERSGDPETYARDFAAFLFLIKLMAFEQLRLNRLFTETYDIRSHHISILEHAGFVREGVMRHHVRIGERAVDSILHGCLRLNGE